MPAAFDFITLTPSGTPNPSLAIAGARAGALGVLNLAFAHDQASIVGALDVLADRAAGRRWGALVDADIDSQLTTVLEHPQSPRRCTPWF